ncbi:hypothetical protein [Catalinimonas niigatensis]|uniref:hypothetical protein n=1 Tax=Catalinimonas niigatensis TaxID=1397264 RepID=UPI0026657EF5|nr:hypothetical protein [Catalinimonas niigatensis]WPP49115.1 hypothetical protein PZB72_20830 [Catalinimonas niigatensis]
MKVIQNVQITVKSKACPAPDCIYLHKDTLLTFEEQLLMRGKQKVGFVFYLVLKEELFPDTEVT